jgi:hypothetical protein
LDPSAKRVYSDTNPTNDFGQEETAVHYCATLDQGPNTIYTEYMAARGNNLWCPAQNYNEPCWRRNSDSRDGSTISVYFAELYTSNTRDVDSLLNNWLVTDYGANSANSYPVVDIQPLAGNGSGMNSTLGYFCNLEGNNNGWLSLYAAAPTYGQLTSSDYSQVNQTLNNCTG